MVPLVAGVWAGAKTVVIGQIQSQKKACKQRPEQQVESRQPLVFFPSDRRADLWQTGDCGNGAPGSLPSQRGVCGARWSTSDPRLCGSASA